MRKILFASAISLLMVSCNSKDEKKEEEKKEDVISSKDADMKALYEKNLVTLKAFIADFEKEDSNGLASLVADSAIWHSPAYGDSDSTKAHWMGSLKSYLANWSNLHLTDGNFLPGIDGTTHELDGSVRYYGRWDGIHSSGVATKLKFYGTYDFNKDNKIIRANDFFDLGGMMNAIKPAAK